MPTRPREAVPAFVGAVTLVAGPPCGGKTTYVRDRMTPGDLVLDYDALANALTADSGHYYQDGVRPFVRAARDAVLGLLHEPNELTRAWVIRSAPTAAERDNFRREFSARVVVVKAPPSVCLQRVADGRPQGWDEYVTRWFLSYQPDPRDEVVDTGGS